MSLSFFYNTTGLCRIGVSSMLWRHSTLQPRTRPISRLPMNNYYLQGPVNQRLWVDPSQATPCQLCGSLPVTMTRVSGLQLATVVRVGLHLVHHPEISTRNALAPIHEVVIPLQQSLSTMAVVLPSHQECISSINGNSHATCLCNPVCSTSNLTHLLQLPLWQWITL